MIIETEYSLGEIVYLRMREDKKQGMITGVTIRPGKDGSTMSYNVTWGDTAETMHYSIELTREYLPEFV